MQRAQDRILALVRSAQERVAGFLLEIAEHTAARQDQAFALAVGADRMIWYTATVNITINPVNDAPVANNDAAAVAEAGTTTTVDVLANDSDVDSTLNAASITSFGQG